MNIPIITFALDSCQKGQDFFGLVPWYHYLPSSDFDGCDFKAFHLLPSSTHSSDVPLVLVAVVDDLLRIAGIVAVAFVIVGAIQYIKSEGAPDQTAKAQSTIINSLIGLAIAVTAIAFVSFLGSKLGN